MTPWCMLVNVVLTRGHLPAATVVGQHTGIIITTCASRSIGTSLHSGPRASFLDLPDARMSVAASEGSTIHPYQHHRRADLHGHGPLEIRATVEHIPPTSMWLPCDRGASCL